MYFNSLDFAVFLPIVFCLYWSVARLGLKVQNSLVVCASYFFYGWWDWRFLTLIVFSTLVDFLVARGLRREENATRRKGLLWISVLVNLGLLGFFKYSNFFLDSFVNAFSLFGVRLEAHPLTIVLPVGISFYTFQTLSYTIDVYRRKLEPTDDFVAFSAFVSFFPQLVAGPIERATQLLPQFEKTRAFDYDKAMDGVRQMLWGLFKKIVIADNCAQYANLIFRNSTDYSGSTLVMGALFFTFQIYGDFSGYSDIAIGASRLFGFDLMRNFAYPYFSRDIAEFWRRWHISLSTWFRDYLYYPLGGSRGGVWQRIRNTCIVFLVSGLWHGANWTFVVWGALNALYFLPLLLTNSNRRNVAIVAEGRHLPSLRELLAMALTFSLTVLAWVVFRAENLTHAFDYLSTMLSMSLFEIPHFAGRKQALITIALVIVFLIIEWCGREHQYAIEKVCLRRTLAFRWGLAYLLVFTIIMFGRYESNPFIYFQF